MRSCSASLLEASASPVVLSDVEGWITHANVGACHVFMDAQEAPLGTLLPMNGIPPRAPHWAVDAGGDRGGPARDESARVRNMPRLVRFDEITGALRHVHIDSALFRMTPAAQGRRNSTLMFVTMSPGSSRMADELMDCSVGSGAGAGVAAGQQRTSSVPHECCLRVTPHDFLFALPPPCSPVEAAFMAQGMLQRVADNSEGAPPDIARAATADDLQLALFEHRRSSRAAPAAPAFSGSRGPIELDLADALRRNAIGVQYQPQFDLRTGRVCGVEALHLTVSMGIANFEGDSKRVRETVQSLLELADANLYASQPLGRNRVPASTSLRPRHKSRCGTITGEKASVSDVPGICDRGHRQRRSIVDAPRRDARSRTRQSRTPLFECRQDLRRIRAFL